MWAAWYAWMQNDVLATGIMSFVMHEIVYFGRSLPWIIIDRIPYFNKYKLQNVRPRAARVTCGLAASFVMSFRVAQTDRGRSKKSPPLRSNGIAQS